MKKFFVSLFSNRFGIVLATLNLCYLASKVHNYAPRPLDMPVISANAPALAAAVSLVEFGSIFAPEISFEMKLFLGLGFAFVFVLLQWLLIARFAKTLAAKIRRPKL